MNEPLLPAGPLSRRRFIQLVGAGALLSLTPAWLVAEADTARARRKGRWMRWSDPQTWGGRTPRRGTRVVIEDKVILDRNATVASVFIGRGGALMFDPKRSLTLSSKGNVVVLGRLIINPGRASRTHRLLFPSVDEGRFAGGGMDVQRSDVGLWVMGPGVLRVIGSPRQSWTRATEAVPAGATTMEVFDEPVGWRIGDEIIITPTISPAARDHHLSYDAARVAGIAGRTITLDRATAHNHPRVDVGAGRTMTAEILNLSRNVVIEGTPTGRAHIFIHSERPQTVKWAALRHLGPRQPAPRGSRPVLGRYGLHFHHCENGSRGSVVDGVVARDIGNHVFVPHTSHGITFRGCITHDTVEDPYWWDLRPDRDSPAPSTHRILFDRCIASLVRTDPDFEGYTLAGFFLGQGDGNAARGCVAVGVQGNVNASGFKWPSDSEGIWEFEDCVAHNNVVHGLWVWQVTSKVHTLRRFIGYHNRGSGIQHGAYDNNYHYVDCILYGNALTQLFSWATSRGALRFQNLLCDAAGLSDYAAILAGRTIGSEQLISTVEASTLRGFRKAAVTCTFDFHDYGPNRPLWVLKDCDYGVGTPFWISDSVHERSEVTVQDRRFGTLILRRKDQPGVPRPEWNASVQVVSLP